MEMTHRKIPIALVNPFDYENLINMKQKTITESYIPVANPIPAKI